MSESGHGFANNEYLVLCKAALNAADRLGLPDTMLAALLVIDVSRVRVLRAGLDVLKPQTEEWRHAVMLVQVYQGLLCVVGSDCGAKRWLSSKNLALGARPFELLTQQGGLERLLEYIDAARAIH